MFIMGQNNLKIKIPLWRFRWQKGHRHKVLLKRSGGFILKVSTGSVGVNTRGLGPVRVSSRPVELCASPGLVVVLSIVTGPRRWERSRPQTRTQRLGMYTVMRTENRRDSGVLDAAAIRQQRRLKQAIQFLHKDSADLLPLDGLKKLGTSNQGVRHPP